MGAGSRRRPLASTDLATRLGALTFGSTVTDTSVTLSHLQQRGHSRVRSTKFQQFAIPSIETQIQRTDVLAHLAVVSCSGYDGRDLSVVENPPQGQLCERDAALFGDRPQAFEGLVVVAIRELREQGQSVPAIVTSESRVATVLPREQALC